MRTIHTGATPHERRERRRRFFTEAAADPRAFRAALRLERGGPPLGRIALPWQADDFAATDAAWCRAAGVPVPADLREQEDAAGGPVSRAWLERPRGHSKTLDTAAMLAWAVRFARHPARGVVAAADADQAGLVRDALAALARANPALLAGVEVGAKKIRNAATGAEAQFISGDAASSYGLTPAFVVCDELCHWKDDRLWHSLLSSAAKTPACLLVVLTNAGWGRDWRWAAREAARAAAAPDYRGGRRWAFRRVPGPCAPWVTPDSLAEQEAMLPRPVYRRLWLNEWQSAGAAAFFTPAEVAACVDEIAPAHDCGVPGVRYAAGLDYGEKRDRTACCLAHRDRATGRIVIDRLAVAAPAAGRPVPVSFIEDWVNEVARLYPGVRVVADDYQLAGLAQRLAGRVTIERFAFAGGKGNDDLARSLRRAVLGGRLAFRPGVGTVSPGSLPGDTTGDGDGERDDLAAELRALELVERPGGRVRFDHPPGGHDDRAFALSLAVWALGEEPAAPPDALHISGPAF